MALETLYTPDQVAEYLGVNRATVYVYLVHGDLKGKKVGLRKWIITESALKAFVADEDEAKAQAARHHRLLDYIAKLAEAGEFDADRDPAARDRLLSDIEKRLGAGEFDADPDAL
jgi:excisionase family DNA binding protein